MNGLMNEAQLRVNESWVFDVCEKEILAAD